MLLAYLLSDRLLMGEPGTAEAAAAVVDAALERTQPAHQALWGQLGRSERVVLAAAADGVPPGSRALAAEHQVARRTFGVAADRLADQGHLRRTSAGTAIVDPLLAEWLRRR
jgi:hypothetical protein